MTFRQIKICLWVIAIVSTLVATIVTGEVSFNRGYKNGYEQGKSDIKTKYFTEDNKCTVMLDDGGSVDGYCIETGKPSYPSDFIGPIQNYNFKEENL